MSNAHDPSPTNVHLLNTSIIPSGCDGVFEAVTISLALAKRLFVWAIQRGNEGQTTYPESHIGHESTAAIMTQLLGSKMSADRTPWDGSGIAIVLQMTGRPPEGKILTEAEMVEFGFTWRMLRRIGEPSNVLPDLDGGEDMGREQFEAGLAASAEMDPKAIEF